jgi:Flp pilus assembly protein TadD
LGNGERNPGLEKADTNFPGVHSGLGQIYLKQGQLDSAETQFRDELKRFPADAVSNCLLGQIVIGRNEAGEARLLFLAALAANPRYKEALFGLGKAEIKLGDPSKALDPLRKAVQLDPSYFQAHYQLGAALASLGHQEEAKKEREICASIQAKQRGEYAKKLSAQ